MMAMSVATFGMTILGMFMIFSVNFLGSQRSATAITILEAIVILID